MATGNITKRTVDALTPGSAAAFLWDSDVKGFGVKVTPTGARRYVYQYRLGGRESKVRRFTIGQHGPWTPDAARKEAKRLSQLVDQGVDPAALTSARRREAVELAFPTYLERFIGEYLKPNWIGGHELAAGILRRDALPILRRKSLSEITRTDVTAVMDRLAGRPATRRNAFAALRALFKWAVNRGDISASPLRDMEAPPAPASRDRVLTDQELGRVWLAASQAGYPFGTFTRLLILTGQRREEVAALEWSELNRAAALWTLPAARAKNDKVHDVPLPLGAVALLDGIAGRARPASEAVAWPTRGYVFTMTGNKPITGYSAAKKRIDRLIRSLPVASGDDHGMDLAPWRFHDLRRTLATGLQKLGVRFEVTEAVLNHLSGSKAGVAGVYQRHDWAAEKRDALTAWAAHVAEAVVESYAEMKRGQQ